MSSSFSISGEVGEGLTIFNPQAASSCHVTLALVTQGGDFDFQDQLEKF